jgi:hypothetical protein
MTRYLLSVHSVAGEVRAPMTDEEMQQFYKQVVPTRLRRRYPFIPSSLHPFTR